MVLTTSGALAVSLQEKESVCWSKVLLIDRTRQCYRTFARLMQSIQKVDKR